MITESVKRRILPYLENLDPSTCRNYKALNRDAYGDIQEMQNGIKKHHRAHRIAYMLYHRVEIPADKVIMHSCDNPACVNPFHLSIGTHMDNSIDKVQKGRQAKGRRNGRYKHGHYAEYDHVEKIIEFQSVFNRTLSKEQVLEIKELIKNKNIKLKTIAEKYNVKETVVRDISAGRTYKNIVSE